MLAHCLQYGCNASFAGAASRACCARSGQCKRVSVDSGRARAGMGCGVCSASHGHMAPVLVCVVGRVAGSFSSHCFSMHALSHACVCGLSISSRTAQHFTPIANLAAVWGGGVAGLMLTWQGCAGHQSRGVHRKHGSRLQMGWEGAANSGYQGAHRLGARLVS